MTGSHEVRGSIPLGSTNFPQLEVDCATDSDERPANLDHQPAG